METDDYRLTKWHGMDNWQCKHCPFSTVGGLGEMIAHVAGRHGMTRPAGGPTSSLAVVVPQIADEEE